MIVGNFDNTGRPRVEGIIYIPRFAIRGAIVFLLDTGADITCVNPFDANRLQIPHRRMSVPTGIGGVGGAGYFSTERAYVAFENGERFSAYEIDLYIANSETGGLPSLLGRDIINRWRIDYDPSISKLECTVRSDDSPS